MADADKLNIDSIIARLLEGKLCMFTVTNDDAVSKYSLAQVLLAVPKCASN